LKNTKNHPTLRSGAVLIIAPMCGKRSLSTDGHQTHKKGKKINEQMVQSSTQQQRHTRSLRFAQNGQ
jgi:hypothetical protein